MERQERSLGRKLTEWALGDVPFGWFTSDRGLELKYDRNNVEAQMRQNSLIVEALTQRGGAISLPECAAGDDGTFAGARGSLVAAQDLFDALREGQAANAVIGREISYSLQDIRAVMEQSVDVQRSAVAVMAQGVEEQRLMRELFQEELTTLPEVLLEEIIRNETERIHVPKIVDLMRGDIHHSLQKHGAKGSSEASASLAVRYFRGSITDLTANSAAETAFLMNRTETMQRMLQEVLKRFKQGDVDEHSARTGKRAMRAIMNREVDLGETKRRFEGHRRKLIRQYADFGKRTNDTHLLGSVERAVGEQIQDVSTQEKDALVSMEQRAGEAGKVLESITGVQLSVRNFDRNARGSETSGNP